MGKQPPVEDSSSNSSDEERAKFASESRFEDSEYSHYEEEAKQHYMTLRGKKLSAALSFVSGTGFTLFGYGDPPFASLSSLLMYSQL